MERHMLAAAVRFQIVKESMKDRLRDDEGEIGSWILLAAFLALAALAVGGAVAGWIGTETGKITGTGASDQTNIN